MLQLQKRTRGDNTRDNAPTCSRLYVGKFLVHYPHRGPSKFKALKKQIVPIIPHGYTIIQVKKS